MTDFTTSLCLTTQQSSIRTFQIVFKKNFSFRLQLPVKVDLKWDKIQFSVFECRSLPLQYLYRRHCKQIISRKFNPVFVLSWAWHYTRYDGRVEDEYDLKRDDCNIEKVHCKRVLLLLRRLSLLGNRKRWYDTIIICMIHANFWNRYCENIYAMKHGSLALDIYTLHILYLHQSCVVAQVPSICVEEISVDAL